MPGNEIYDLIIIGGGPGGLTAGIYAMRAALKTALIELGAPGGQMNNSDSVENWPGDEYIGGADLAMKFSQHAQSYGLDVISQEVVELVPGLDVHTVKLANGDSLRAHAIILATGGSPRKLDIPVFYTMQVREESGIDLFTHLHRIIPERRAEFLRIPACIRGTWDAEVIKELKPLESESCLKP